MFFLMKLITLCLNYYVIIPVYLHLSLSRRATVKTKLMFLTSWHLLNLPECSLASLSSTVRQKYYLKLDRIWIPRIQAKASHQDTQKGSQLTRIRTYQSLSEGGSYLASFWLCLSKIVFPCLYMLLYFYHSSCQFGRDDVEWLTAQ